MVAESYEEEVAKLTQGTKEELAERIVALQQSLERAFRPSYEPDKELVRNPQVWVDYINAAINRAICLLTVRKDHPELEELFARLEASYDGADGRMPEYQRRMRLS